MVTTGSNEALARAGLFDPRIVSEVELDSWMEFKELVNRMIDGTFEDLTIDKLWFRGHLSSDWNLISSFDRRLLYIDALTRKRIQDTMLAEYRTRSNQSGTDDEVLAILQHLGTPTRLLDWSRSPYVAAFFALADTLDPGMGVLPDETVTRPSHAVVYCLKRDAACWQSDTGVSLYEPPPTISPRVAAQLGTFTVNRSTEVLLEEYVQRYYTARGNHPERVLWRFVFPREFASKALRDLRLMSVTSERLFPGEEGTARFSFFSALDAAGALP